MASKLSQLSFLLFINITKSGQVIVISEIVAYINPDTQNFKQTHREDKHSGIEITVDFWHL